MDAITEYIPIAAVKTENSQLNLIYSIGFYLCKRSIIVSRYS